MITALKVAFVANLIATVLSIAAAIAAAVASGGVASGFIVAAKENCKKLLKMAINLASSKLLAS